MYLNRAIIIASHWTLLFYIFCCRLAFAAPPVITSQPITVATEDSQYEYTIVAEDEDGDNLVYTLDQQPTWIVYNNSTNTISGTPANNHVGTSGVSFSVTDGNTTVIQTFNITVINTNDPPVVTTNINNVTVNEDEAFQLSVSSNFSDVDIGDTLTFSAANLPTGLNITANGLISGFPNNSDAINSPFDITITATDDVGANVSTNFQISVLNINDAPEPVNDIALVTEDGSTNIPVLDNDIDVDDPILPATTFITLYPLYGVASVDTNTGIISYTPNPNYSGADSFHYRVRDPGGLYGSARVDITVVAVNDPPVAQNDIVSTNEDTTVAINVLINDSDPDIGDEPQGDKIVITTLPSHGQISINNGQVLYTPDSNFSGIDSFIYKVADLSDVYTNEATVTINIGSLNDFPIANDDLASTIEDQDVTFSVADNDTDVEDGTLDPTTIVFVNQPTQGTVYLNNDGSITYSPANNFNGTDEFQYTIKDSDNFGSNAATVRLTVIPVNDNPQANNDLVNINEDQTVTINVLGNDLDLDDPNSIDLTSIIIDTDPQSGYVTIDTIAGTVSYTPQTNYVGQDSFQYSMADEDGLRSNVATVNIDIHPVNDPPNLVDDSVNLLEDNNLVINILTNDFDIDGTIDKASLTFTQQPAHGTVSFNSQGQVIYTPDLNYNGNDQFSYTANDDDNLPATKAATVLLTITPVNDQPIATNAANQTSEDQPLTLTLSGTDVDGDPLTFNINTQPSHGGLTGNGSQWTYTPDANYFGSDSFTFTASDGQLTSAPATFTIEVISINDRPVPNDQNLTFNEDQSINIVLTATDIENDTLNYQLSGGNIGGILTGTPPQLIYTPAANFYGTETLQFYVNDGALNSSNGLITLNILPVNDQPTVNGENLFLAEDSSIAIILSAADIDSDPLTYVIAESPDHGVLTGIAPSLIYIPDENYFGDDSFSFYVNDGTIDSEPASISLTISPRDDEPIANIQTIIGDEDNPIAFTLSGEDPDGGPITYQIVTSPVHGELSGEIPNLIYQGNQDFYGTDILTFRVSDGNNTSASASVTIQVNPMNDPPQANPDTFNLSMAGQNWLTLDVLSNDLDIDGDPLSLLSANSDFGSVLITENKLRFVPPIGFEGEVDLDYLVQDAEGSSSAAEVLLNVRDNNSNNGPQITTSGDIQLISSGALTKVSIEPATAVDNSGNPISVELIDSQRIFPSGSHNIFWRAEDQQNRITIASQTINIYPLVSLSPSQIIEEGGLTTVTFNLNGPAPLYPIAIPYSISGTAELGIDFQMETEYLVIEQGTAAKLVVNTFLDDIIDDNETIVIQLGDSNYASQQQQHTITIVENNQPHTATLVAQQDQTYRQQIAQNGGLVTITAEIIDPNPNDQHQINWQLPDSFNIVPQQNQQQLEFSAVDIPEGRYQISAIITDQNQPPTTHYQSLWIDIVANLAPLTNQDSDGDLQPDNIEGHADDDRDGIPNYLDPLNDCRFIPIRQEQATAFWVESQAGSCLRLGEYQQGELAIPANLLAADPETQAYGEITNLIINRLLGNHLSVDLVIPQYRPLPNQGTYRQYQANQGWTDFVSDQHNAIASTRGQYGVCPEPQSQAWQPGLTLGDWCIRLTIEDGGPNDGDGFRNHSISSTAGVTISNSNNQPPIANPDLIQMIWNQSISIDVLTNDIDPDMDPLTIINAEAELGNLSIDLGEPNQINYTPLTNFIGTDVVSYSIADGRNGVASTSLTIAVNGNHAPLALDDNGTTTNDQNLTVQVLINDTDQDQDNLQVIASSIDPSHGTVTHTSTSIVYTPPSNFVGTAIISYQVSDGRGGESTAKVYIDVSAADTPQPPDNNQNSSSGGSMDLALLTLLILRRRKMFRLLS